MEKVKGQDGAMPGLLQLGMDFQKVSILPGDNPQMS